MKFQLKTVETLERGNEFAFGRNEPLKRIDSIAISDGRVTITDIHGVDYSFRVGDKVPVSK